MNDAYWILRAGADCYIDEKNVFILSSKTTFAHLPNVTPVGTWQGLPLYAADAAAESLPYTKTSLRPLFALGGTTAFTLAGRAFQLIDWQQNNRFCGRCASPMYQKEEEPAMHCRACGHLVYPRISPAVMVLISRETEGTKELLLARSAHFKAGMYSAVAGFLEVGETAEAAAHREVAEEVGVEITNLRYFDTQPWPFPDSLMIAFFADYRGGTLCVDKKELEDAAWFSIDNLPLLPDPASIARRLIDAYLA